MGMIRWLLFFIRNCKTLGINMNQLDISSVTSFLESGEENAE